MKSNFTTKTHLLFGLLLGALFFISGFAFLNTNSELRGERGEYESENPNASIELEFQKMRDPHLNIVPNERMVTALNYYAAEKGLNKTTTTLGSITWTERGPTAVGGRTRALIFDANDATHKTVFAGSVGGGLWKCTDITQSSPVWTPVNDQFSNLAITTIAQDPTNAQILYFGTGEGFYNVDAIRGNGIWKSTNGGTTWTQLSATASNNDFAYVQKIIVTSTGDVYAACRGLFSNTGGLQKSTNGGTSWTRVIGSGSTDMNAADIEEAANGDLYASVGIFSTGKIYKSPSGATVGNSGTWTNITPSGTFQRIELACAPSNSSEVYAICQGSGYEVSHIYSSSNGGTSWTNRTVPTIYDQGSNSSYTRGQAWYDLIAAVDPSTATTLYIGGVDMLKSTDQGATWTQITNWSLYNNPGNPLSPFPWAAAQNVHADIHQLVFKPGTNTTMLLGCDGGIYYSTNLTVGAGLPSWDAKNTSYDVTQYYTCATHPTNANFFLGGAQDNGSHKFTTSGLNTGVQVNGGDGAFCFISSVNGNNQITAYTNNYYSVSTDGGSTFNDLNGSDGSGKFINPADLDATNSILYASAGANTLARYSSVFGAATRTDLTVSIGGAEVSAVKVSPNTPTTVYIGTDAGKVYRVTNANGSPTVTSLTSTALGSGGNISSIDIVKRATNTDDSILVAVSNYGVNSVYYTSNGTVSSPTWVNIDDNNTLQDIPVRWAIFSPVNSQFIFLGTEIGVFATGNVNGASTVWTQINNSSLPQVRVDMLKVNSNNELLAATHGRGMWTSVSIAPLALKLISFDVQLQNNKSVALQWEVNSDKEAKSYTIERAYDGFNFQPIQTITAKGENTYTANDADFDSHQQTIYYRLKAFDVKGDYIYSGVRTVHITTSDNFIQQVYPTVSKGLLHINTGNANVTSMRVQVYDMFGKMHMNTILPYSPTTIDMQGYAAGNYIVVITSNDGVYKFTSRAIIQ